MNIITSSDAMIIFGRKDIAAVERLNFSVTAKNNLVKLYKVNPPPIQRLREPHEYEAIDREIRLIFERNPKELEEIYDLINYLKQETLKTLQTRITEIVANEEFYNKTGRMTITYYVPESLSKKEENPIEKVDNSALVPFLISKSAEEYKKDMEDFRNFTNEFQLSFYYHAHPMYKFPKDRYTRVGKAATGNVYVKALLNQFKKGVNAQGETKEQVIEKLRVYLNTSMRSLSKYLILKLSPEEDAPKDERHELYDRVDQQFGNATREFLNQGSSVSILPLLHYIDELDSIIFRMERGL